MEVLTFSLIICGAIITTALITCIVDHVVTFGCRHTMQTMCGCCCNNIDDNEVYPYDYHEIP